MDLSVTRPYRSGRRPSRTCARSRSSFSAASCRLMRSWSWSLRSSSARSRLISSSMCVLLRRWGWGGGGERRGAGRWALARRAGRPGLWAQPLDPPAPPPPPQQRSTACPACPACAAGTAHPVPSSMRRSSSISCACRLSTAASDSTSFTVALLTTRLARHAKRSVLRGGGRAGGGGGGGARERVGLPASLATPAPMPKRLSIPGPQRPPPPTHPPVRLLHVHHGGGAGADDGGLGVAAQRGLQDARQLGVPVRDVAACGGRPGGAGGREEGEGESPLAWTSRPSLPPAAAHPPPAPPLTAC